MRNLFDSTTVAEVQTRLQQLRADSPRQWGTMTPAQAMEHCARSFELASGTRRPARVLIGRVLGPIVKPLVLRDDAPLRRNSPTVPDLVIGDDTDFDAARQRLSTSIDRFAKDGAAECTSHPHAFFGRLNPDEWAVLMYKHVDHHLRQFGA